MKKVLLIVTLRRLVTGCHYAIEKVRGVTGSGVRKVEKRLLLADQYFSN